MFWLNGCRRCSGDLYVDQVSTVPSCLACNAVGTENSPINPARHYGSWPNRLCLLRCRSGIWTEPRAAGYPTADVTSPSP